MSCGVASVGFASYKAMFLTETRKM